MCSPTNERNKKIKSAYQSLGNGSFYDGMITNTTFLGSAVNKIVWDYNQNDNNLYIERALSGIENDFKGKLLDVPVGTGILTIPFYSTLKDADITCIDYSKEMLMQAKEKTEKLQLTNIKYQVGDVGHLEFEDHSFDRVLSMNGFHAFPDKEAAYNETYRVLKTGGKFCGCFYIKGQCSRTDKFIDTVYVKKGYFTPPFETLESFTERMNKMYSKVEITNVKSIVCFTCTK
ncbi:putative methyltransferase [Piromyces finnis]|uniref:Putative methyltransferase n=1 Tax=Piromyces finnis TaxID=1754191 RepID=A0A1Y1V741_9FUNG|nr:putative methyltransferase [Piromyces finnis]|eukprot:ORX48935.1 putative methyltransferase [Piromyces finnis]